MKAMLKKDKALRWLCIALALILLSGIGASAAETNGYNVKVTDMKLQWAQMANEIRENAALYGKDVEVTFNGSNGSADMSSSTKQLSFKLLVPENATSDTPAPAIVCVHGFYNNKEMQDAYYVELARRGYVVIALDMAGHGSSDVTFDPSANIILATDNSGMEACVEWVMSQAYVDESKIGITGHSQGGRTCGWTMQHLIRAGHGDYVKAYLGQANSAGLTAILDEFGAFPDTLTTGTIMCKYDEFSIVRDNSYDYLNSDQAKLLIRQSYPDFADGETIQAGAFYTSDGIAAPDTSLGETLGKKASVVYWPNIIHPWAHFSSRCSAYASEFFYAALGIADGAEYIAPSKQIWQIKELFNLIGLIGLALMIVPTASLLMRLSVFAPLKKGTTVIDARLPEYKGAKVKVPFWLCGLLMTFLSAAIFQPLYTGYRYSTYLFPTSSQYPLTTGNTIGMWTAACGVLAIVLTLVFWGVRALLNRKTSAYYDNPFECARLESINEFLRAALLAAILVCAVYTVVWAQYLVWGTDFRVWYIAVLPFEFAKVGVILRYVPFFMCFYLANALCNANNRFKGMAEWKGTALSCLFSVLGLVVIIAIQYITMVETGNHALWMLESDAMMFAIGGALGYILLIGIVPIIVVSNIISRKLYLMTGSIWVGGLTNGALCTLIFCANTFTQYSYTLAT